MLDDVSFEILTALALAAGVGLFLFRKPYVALLLFVALLPLVPKARLIIPFRAIPVYLIDLCLMVVILAFLLKTVMEGRKRRFRLPVDGPVVWIAILTVPSLIALVARWPQVVFEAVYFLGRSWLHILVFFGVTWLVISRPRLDAVVRVLYYSTLILSFWAILQGLPPTSSYGVAITEYHNEIFRVESKLFASQEFGVNRVNGGYSTANDLGGYLAVIAPLILFGLLSRGAPRVRPPAYLGVPMILLALALTYSRTAWLAVAIGMLAAGWLSLNWRSVSITRYVPWGAVALVLVSVSVSQFTPNAARFVAVRSGELLSNPLGVVNLRSRLESYPNYLPAIIDEPNILIWGQSLRTIDLQERGLLPGGEFKGFVSNSWLLIVLDVGLAPFLLYLFIYLHAVVAVRRQLARRDSPASYRGLLLGAFGALAAAGAAYLGDNYMAVSISMHGLFFLVLGLSYVILSLAREESSREPSPVVAEPAVRAGRFGVAQPT